MREEMDQRYPHFTLTALTQLKCEDTATLSGVTHIVQPACISLFGQDNLAGNLSNTDDKEQKKIHVIDLVWTKTWKWHLDSFAFQML